MGEPPQPEQPTAFFKGHVANFENHDTEAIKRIRSANRMIKYAEERKLSAEQKAEAIASLEKNMPLTEAPDVKAAFEKRLAALKAAK